MVLSFNLSAQTASSVRNADAPCAACHKAIYDSYLRTPMANASGSAADNRRPGEYRKDPDGADYRIHLEDGQLLLTFGQSQPPLSGTRRLDYFLGSGHLGTTYLYSLNGYLLESPVAYYAASGHLDMKPGIASSSQISPALPVRSTCLRCHMSAVQPSDPGSVDHYGHLPFLHTGITCEACHGSTALHVATAGKAPVVNPAKLPEAKRDSVCISCHLEGDITVEKPNTPALRYTPGEDISSYLAYFVFAGKEPTRRGVSEVEQLSLSRCKRISGVKMSCSSCHDPHADPAPSERVAFYRSRCLACHTGAAFAAAHHPENPDCTACHMPRTGSENIPHVAWTDHRILRNPQDQPLLLRSPHQGELTPIFSTNTTNRDLGLAYYNASFNGESRLRSKAYALLKPQEDGLADSQSLDALGSMSSEAGDFAAATRIYRRVLQLDPTDFDAASNLGTLLARSGSLAQAVDLWTAAFQRNQDIPGLGLNLARAQCRLGDTTAAKATLDSILTYSPGDMQALHLLSLLPGCKAAAK